MDEKLIKQIARELNTHDKRYTFLKILFPRLVSRIALEGSAEQAAYNIEKEFSKQGMLVLLKTELDRVFNHNT